jgi:hypothetical protein
MFRSDSYRNRNISFLSPWAENPPILTTRAFNGYSLLKILTMGGSPDRPDASSTLPYLARRAEEYTAIAGQISKGLEIIIQERNRRKTANTPFGSKR